MTQSSENLYFGLKYTYDFYGDISGAQSFQMLGKQTYTGIRPIIQTKHILQHGDMVQPFGQIGCHILEMILVKNGLVQTSALCEECVLFYTAQHTQDITLYYIHSDCKST